MKKKIDTGDAIRRARVSHHLSQFAVARAVGRQQWWMSRVETGVVRLDGDTIDKILAAIVRLGELKKSPAIFADLAIGDGRMSRPANTLQGSAV